MHRIAHEPQRVSRLTYDDTTTDRQVNCEYNIANDMLDVDDDQSLINKDDFDEGLATERKGDEY